MRTFVGTYKLDKEYSLDFEFNKPLSREIKYKFEKNTIDDKTIVYVTIVAQNRVHLRLLKAKNKKYLKGLGKVELIVGVG